MSDTYQTPEAIERDIQRTREGLGRKLDSLQDQLAPGEMAGDALDYVKTTGAQLGSGLARTVRENPIPVALIGLGVGWLLLSGRKGGRREADHGELPNYSGMTYPTLPAAPDEGGADGQSGAGQSGIGQSGIGQTAGKARAVARKVGQDVAESGQDMRHRAAAAGQDARHGLRQARDKAGHLAQEARARGIRAKDATGEFVDRNPLAVGALGLLAGAVIGAVLPPSRKERQIVGPYRQAAEHYADEAAAAAVRDGTERATAAAQTLTDRLHAQVGSGQGAKKGSDTNPAGEKSGSAKSAAKSASGTSKASSSTAS